MIVRAVGLLVIALAAGIYLALVVPYTWTLAVLLIVALVSVRNAPNDD